MTIVLFIAAIAGAQLDPQTGLWFPPYASKTEYLSRDPAHPLMADIQRAFKEKPALADEVCAAYVAAPEPQTAESHDPSVRQFRTMFAMLCLGRGAKARRQTEDAQRMTGALTTLQPMFDAEERSFANWTSAQREKRATELVDSMTEGGQRLRPALQAIALSPSYTFAIHTMLDPSASLTDGKTTVSSAQAAAFLEQLYRARSSANAADADEWRAGLPALLLFDGKLADAKKAAEDWYAAAPREHASFARAMLSVIERASGQEGAFDKLAAGCVPSSSWKAENPESDPADYCRKAAAGLVINALDVQRERAPHGLVDAAFELETTMFQDVWPDRLALVEKAGYADPAAAKKHFYAMLADRDIPDGARLDAVYYLAKLAAKNDAPRVAPLVDCWIHLQGADMAPANAEMWKRLGAMGVHGGKKPSDCDSGAPDTWCILNALSMERETAVRMQQWDAVRLVIEKMASIVIASGDDPTPVRTELMELAESELRFGRRANAVQILSFLKSQPEDEYVTSRLTEFGGSVPAGAAQPWQSPAAAGPAGDCPPRP